MLLMIYNSICYCEIPWFHTNLLFLITVFEQQLLCSISSPLCTGCWIFPWGDCLRFDILINLESKCLDATDRESYSLWFVSSTDECYVSLYHCSFVCSESTDEILFLYITVLYQLSSMKKTDYVSVLRRRMRKTSAFACDPIARGIGDHLISVLWFKRAWEPVNDRTIFLHPIHLAVLELVCVSAGTFYERQRLLLDFF